MKTLRVLCPLVRKSDSSPDPLPNGGFSVSYVVNSKKFIYRNGLEDVIYEVSRLECGTWRLVGNFF